MGYGDELMASADLARLQAANPGARIVIGDGVHEVTSTCDAVFDGNPHRARLADVRPGECVVWLKNYYGCRPYLDYAHGDGGVRQAFTAYRAAPGELYLSAAEQAGAAAALRPLQERGAPLVSIEPHAAFGPNKQWGLAKWNAVVEARRDRVSFVQPSYGEPLLAGVRGVPSTFRSYCAILARCAVHVGPEGGLHHAAAALARPAVVLFGGRIHPRTTGYDFHLNLYVDATDSPCGMVAACDHCRRCLDAIPIEAVIDGIDRFIAHLPTAVPAPARRAASHAGGAAQSPRG